MKIESKTIRNQLGELTESKPNQIRGYLDHYNLDLGNDRVEHNFGTFKSGSFTLAGHTFCPKEYRATVIILHGYLCHCGLLNKIIKYFISKDYAVGCFDLPGHGLSSGERTGIDNFAQYSDCLADFLKVIKPQLHGLYHIIGHSTGASIIMDYLLNKKDDDVFDKVILVAPLIRSRQFALSKFGLGLTSVFTKKMFRVFHKVSSDEQFLKFVKHNDNLSPKSFSLQWTKALFKWNQKIATATPLDRPLVIFQGAKDKVISWQYNIRFIQSKFKHADIELLAEARHELFNESKEIRDDLFSKIRDYLVQ